MDRFPYEVPEEYKNMPLLKGRAAVDMKVRVKDNPNVDVCVFRIVLDGYNAPVTAGNFIDLVERHFYDGMEIQRGMLLFNPDKVFNGICTQLLTRKSYQM